MRKGGREGKVGGADLVLPLPWAVGVPAGEHLAPERGGGTRWDAGIWAPFGEWGGGGGEQPARWCCRLAQRSSRGGFGSGGKPGKCATAGFLGKSA